jgi:Double zinc ribbon
MQMEVTTAFRSCPECRHRNPRGSTECAHCGASLKRRFCVGCGAANDVSATMCRSCGEVLSGTEPSSILAPLDSQWGAEPAMPIGATTWPRRRGLRLVLVAAIVAAGAVAGLLMLRPGPSTTAPPQVSSRPAPADAAPAVPAPTAAAPAAAVPAKQAAATPTPSAETGTPARKPAATASTGPADKPSAGATRTAAPAGPTTPATTVAAQGRQPQPQPQPQPAQPSNRPCTPSLAALALCTMNN